MPAVVDEIVGDRLDETGMRLRMLIGGLRLDELLGLVVDIIMALAWAIDAIGPVEPGVEPLRRIGRRHLPRQHEAQLIEKGGRVSFRIEIFAFPAPIGPGPGETVEDLLRRGLAPSCVPISAGCQRLLVRSGAPQKSGHAVFGHPLQPGGNSRLAEIFLREHVRGDLTPGGRNLDAVREKTIDPSGLRISLFVVRNAISA